MCLSAHPARPIPTTASHPYPTSVEPMPRTSCRLPPLLAVLLSGACAGHAAETDAAPKPGGDPAGVAAELLATDSGFAAAGRDLPVVEALAPMLADDVEMPAPGGFIMGRDSVLK